MGLIANTNEEYHASGLDEDGNIASVSKSFLWSMKAKTPYAARFGAHKDKPAFRLGSVAHIAILEPDRLEAAVMKGPADRRGNKWKEAQDFATFQQKILLVEADYELALLIREVAATVPELAMMRDLDDDGQGPIVETSCYHVDEETGLTVRCRPDLYSPRHKLILDIKTATDASPDGWDKAIGDFGYHMQDATYTDVWAGSSGYEVDGFWFLVFEKSDPPQVALYELTPEAVAEGHAQYRRQLQRTKECIDSGEWPSYPPGIQRIGLRHYHHELTPAPEKD